jgi:hypothetical protein
MVDGRFHVHERLVAQIRHHAETRFRKIRGEVASFGKHANADGIAVGSEHRHRLAHVLGSGAVHDCAGARFHLPRPLAGRDDDGRAAEPHHRALERGERAQRRVQEEQPEHLACERLRLRVLLQTPGQSEQVFDLLTRKVGKIEKAFHSFIVTV